MTWFNIIFLATLLVAIACSLNSLHMTSFIAIFMVWSIMLSVSWISWGLDIKDIIVCEVEAEAVAVAVDGVDSEVPCGHVVG